MSATSSVRDENDSRNPDEAVEIDDFREACGVLTAWAASAPA